MRRREAPCKPSRIGWLFRLLQQPEVPYNHVLIDCLAHIVDGQRGHASSGEGLHLDARTVARTGRRGDRPAILAVFNTSPLGNAAFRNSPIVSEDMRTTPPASAVRRTTSFSPTSTILAAPSLSRCENFMSKPPFQPFSLRVPKPLLTC